MANLTAILATPFATKDPTLEESLSVAETPPIHQSPDFLQLQEKMQLAEEQIRNLQKELERRKARKKALKAQLIGLREEANRKDELLDNICAHMLKLWFEGRPTTHISTEKLFELLQGYKAIPKRLTTNYLTYLEKNFSQVKMNIEKRKEKIRNANKNASLFLLRMESFKEYLANQKKQIDRHIEEIGGEKEDFEKFVSLLSLFQQNAYRPNRIFDDAFRIPFDENSIHIEEFNLIIENRKMSIIALQDLVSDFARFLEATQADIPRLQ